MMMSLVEEKESKTELVIVGLGSGDVDQLTLGNFRIIQSAQALFLRTKDHPVVALLDNDRISYETFDRLYEKYATFPEVYEAIVVEIMEKLQRKPEGKQHNEPVVYAVPGHPMVAEKTVQMLLERCREANITVTVTGGESFLDQTFTALQIDPIDGFVLLDASDIALSHLQPTLHTIVAQVYDQYTASDVKLALMERYPDDYEVIVCHALGVKGQEQMIKVPLYEMDHLTSYNNLSLIYIPRSDDDKLRNRTLERLHEIVAILRSPEGCPWDREQTHQSIRKNFIEELYEALEAIDNDDPGHMVEEFGDVLLQIMLHSQMEEEQGMFSVYDVVEALNDKLLFRHPHVFGDQAATSSDQALVHWEQMKQKEQQMKGTARQSILDGIPQGLPALTRAYKLQHKAAKVGFDWPTLEPIIEKVQEELQELQLAIYNKQHAEQMEELGDLLFSVINVARFIKIDAEEALSFTNRKFADRFQYIEQQLRIKGKSFEQTDLVEMDQLWTEAKQR
ncbi:nucleoside triphosphate pyrophosphohydrolase [Paenibacillus yanchengensis]|uniref:Nucleoside triphosphate pyrophosphohydrolase n=1 Tax=Paenibacillus yanchengensis TaxID=2035833 RepID=A0ABW4YI87_9BACL